MKCMLSVTRDMCFSPLFFSRTKKWKSTRWSSYCYIPVVGARKRGGFEDATKAPGHERENSAARLQRRRDIIMTEILRLVRIVLVFFALAPVASNLGFRCSPKHSLWHLHLRGGEHVGLSPTAKDDRGECGGGTDFNYESLFDGCHLAHCMIRVRNNTEMESFLRDEMHMQLLRKETFERFSRMAVTMNSVDSNTDPCAAAAGDAKYARENTTPPPQHGALARLQSPRCVSSWRRLPGTSRCTHGQ